MEEEDAALRRGKWWGGKEWKRKRKKKGKTTTLGDLQRLIACLFLGLGFDLHRNLALAGASLSWGTSTCTAAVLLPWHCPSPSPCATNHRWAKSAPSALLGDATRAEQGSSEFSKPLHSLEEGMGRCGARSKHSSEINTQQHAWIFSCLFLTSCFCSG